MGIESKAGAEGGGAVASSAWLAIPFEALYAEARSVQDRIMLLKLAKEHHIRKQNFDEAMKYREAEKALKAEVDNAVKTLGASMMANKALCEPHEN
jgi:predicted DsbA family dithiol-disulfide isomerase